MKVCLVPTRVLQVPEAGGYTWVFLNWALGLQANGCTVVWLEQSPPQVGVQDVAHRVSRLMDHFRAVGLEAEIALLPDSAGRGADGDRVAELERLTVPWEAAVEDADLLLNFRHSLESEVVNRFPRSVLVDIDPGLSQIWMSEGQIDVATYDTYVSIGENLNGASGRDGDVVWHHVPPPVYLPAWPISAPEPSTHYTTVTNWSSGEWVVTSDYRFPNDKRGSFLQYLDLPAQVHASLELAVCLSRSDPQDRKDRALLEERGWRVRHAWELTATPMDFRDYVQTSRGEFSCAKPSFIRFQNAWISDRSVCYLASGKPVVVQHTGPSAFLPDGEGIFRFEDLASATSALSACEADYDRQSRAARAFAEEFLDARMLTGRVLELAANGSRTARR